MPREVHKDDMSKTNPAKERTASGLHTPFFDPRKNYEDNFNEGPFGAFADGKVYEQEGEPEYEVFGHKVFLPFGIPPGPLLNGKYVAAALDKGFDVVTYKTIRTREYPSAAWPNVLAVHPEGDLTLEMADKGLIGDTNYTAPISITNSFGVPSFNPDFWQEDMAKAAKRAKRGQLVIGGFQGTTNADGSVEAYIQDFVLAAKLVKETGVPVLEANLSCPNEGTAHLLCFDLDRTEQIVGAIKDEIGDTPLIIKIAYFADQAQLEDLVRRVGGKVDGIAAINTIPSKIFNEKGEQALPGQGRLVAGVCGEPIKWAGLDMVARLKKLREESVFKYEITGVGGVTTPTDYKLYRDAGADVVQSATGAMWNPFLAQEIKKNDQSI